MRAAVLRNSVPRLSLPITIEWMSLAALFNIQAQTRSYIVQRGRPGPTSQRHWRYPSRQASRRSCGTILGIDVREE